MERRYVGVTATGKAEQVINKLCNGVKVLKLGHKIPLIKVEKDPQKEFIIFIALEMEDNQAKNIVPNEISVFLKQMGITKTPLGVFPISGIKKMIGRGIEIYSFNNLQYKSNLENYYSEDPFELTDSKFIEKTNYNIEETKKYDNLLYWLSACAEGTWQSFSNTCLLLGLADSKKQVSIILRKLALLGHIETSSDGLKWSICPSTIIKDPISGSAYLCGQRTPGFLKEFEERFGKLILIEQPLSKAPHVIKVDNFSSAEIKEMSKDIKIIESPSNTLATILPDIEEWKNTLKTIEKIVLQKYKVEKWDGLKYVENLIYEKNGIYEGDSGLYKLTKSIGKISISNTFYFDKKDQKWFKGEWYGLSFLDKINKGPIKIKYSSKNKTLIIPKAYHWPLVYEKALVLASGLLPSYSTDNNFTYYTNISKDLAIILAKKLHLEVEDMT